MIGRYDVRWWGPALVAALAIGLLPPATGGIVLLWLCIPIIALMQPAAAVALVILTIPFQDLLYLPGGPSATQAAVVLAAGGWALRLCAFPEHRLRIGRLFPFWALLLGAFLLSAVLTPYSRAEALRETARWGVAALIWLIAIDRVRGQLATGTLVACLIAAPVGCAVIGIMQFVSGDGPPAFRISADLPFVRAYGTIGQPNSFAGYLNMGWPLALALSIAVSAMIRRSYPLPQRILLIGSAAILWFVTAILLAALLATFSRGAWLGAPARLLAMCVVFSRRAALALLAVAAVSGGMLLFAGLGALPEPIAMRLGSISRNLALFDAAQATVTPENFAVVERMAQLQAAWGMFLSRPLFGIGPGNYHVAYPAFAVGEWYISRGHAHNVYLHLAAESGIIGLLAYLALVGSAAAICIGALDRMPSQAYALRLPGPIRRGILLGCCGIISAVAGHQFFEQLHALNLTIQYAAVLALVEIVTRE
ncbi:MAG TPA: O-antigen ligase family protein [Roseiflexaceae bacterium]|nr:O-antigen ligase family protein [Roseiflexaceae bacterium]